LAGHGCQSAIVNGVGDGEPDAGGLAEPDGLAFGLAPPGVGEEAVEDVVAAVGAIEDITSEGDAEGDAIPTIVAAALGDGVGVAVLVDEQPAMATARAIAPKTFARAVTPSARSLLPRCAV
jgi:hypothetical protein